VNRDILATIIEKQYCPAAVEQGSLDVGSGSLRRRYNEGTMEDIIITMDWSPGLPFKPELKACIQYLRNILTDGCDGGTSPENAQGSKAGGTVKMGEVTYGIMPQTTRQPATLPKWAKCDSVYVFPWFNTNNVWGRGWVVRILEPI
jgi:hypothetical protein